MNTLSEQEIYIRLTDNEAGFVCTVKCGKLYVNTTEFALDDAPLTNALHENSLILAKERFSRRAASEEH
jgi:hypothetical protein